MTHNILTVFGQANIWDLLFPHLSLDSIIGFVHFSAVGVLTGGPSDRHASEFLCSWSAVCALMRVNTTEPRHSDGPHQKGLKEWLNWNAGSSNASVWSIFVPVGAHLSKIFGWLLWPPPIYMYFEIKVIYYIYCIVLGGPPSLAATIWKRASLPMWGYCMILHYFLSILFFLKKKAPRVVALFNEWLRVL